MIIKKIFNLPNSYVTYPTSIEIFGNKIGYLNFESVLSGLPTIALIEIIAFTLWQFEYQGINKMELQVELSKIFLRPSTEERVISCFKRHAITFFPTQFAILLKYILKFGNLNNGEISEDQFKRIGICLLAINDQLFHDHVIRNKEKKDTVAEDENFNLLTSSHWASNDDLINVIFRYRRIFLEIAKNYFEENVITINFENEFIKTIGLETNEFLSFWFYTAVNNLNSKFTGRNPGISDLIITPKSQFLNLKINLNNYFLFINGLSNTIDGAKQIIGLSSNRELLFDFSMFKQKPIIKISDDKYVIISLSYFLDSINSVMFWSIFDNLKLSDSQLIYSQEFGKCFEKYVGDLIEYIFRRDTLLYFSRDQKIKCHNSEIRTPDIILESNESIFVIEISTGRYSNQSTIIEGDIESYRNDVEKKVKHKLGQIFSFLASVSKNEVDFKNRDFLNKKIYPILLTLDSMRPTPFLYKSIQLSFSELNLGASLAIQPFAIIEVKDIEMIVRAKGTTFEREYINWIHNSKYTLSPFGEYIFYRKLDEDENNIIKQDTDKFFNDLGSRFISEKPG